MEFISLNSALSLSDIKTDILIVGKSYFLQQADPALQARLKDTFDRRLNDKAAFVPLEAYADFSAKTVVVIDETANTFNLSNALTSYIKASNAQDASFMVSTFSSDNTLDKTLASTRSIIAGINKAFYQVEKLPTPKINAKQNALNTVSLIVSESDDISVEQVNVAIKLESAISNGKDLARHLGDLPGNVCTPTYLADQTVSLGKNFGIKTTILEEADMFELGMHSLLSVSRGSREPAKLIVAEYYGAADKDEQPYVLVGKGLTFDAGGISIKPSAKMDEMKYDMCGAASMLGTLQAVAELELPINLVVVVPSSENLPDGDANKPGDIVTSMAGLTIEILNTDAEGRLILCDALTYVERFNPKLVIDAATLTGACIVALGHHTSGVLGNDQELVNDIIDAGNTSKDPAWQLPMGDLYHQQLSSNFADMANIGGAGAGTITAACFLSRFTEKYRWAHLDIAGTAWASGANKGATGRCVPLLTQLLYNYSQK